MRVKCECGTSYQPSPKLAGKKVRCKKCSAIIQIPATASPSPQSRKRQQQDALLEKFAGSGSTTLDERMAQRQKQTLEDERIPNVVKHTLLGLGCLGAAAIVYFGLNALENGGIAPRIVWLFVLLKGKFWIPPLLVLTGGYQFFLAYWFLQRSSNVDSD